MAPNLLEDLNAHLNANVFLRAFSFSSSQLPIFDSERPELADKLVLLEGMGFIFQLNERDRKSSARSTEVGKWFEGTVLKKGVKQIRQTRDLLRTYVALSLVNARRHRVTIVPNRVDDLVGVAIYRTHSKSTGVAPPRFRKSRVAGFVHVLRDADYFALCDYLSTPAQMLDYFRFRREVVTRADPLPASVSESALLGQFLLEDLDAAPDRRFEKGPLTFKDDRDASAFSLAMENLGDWIANQESDTADSAYYRILIEIARLCGRELAELKRQIRLTLEAVRADRFELPYRMACGPTDCGFLILPVTSEFRMRARPALQSLAAASKYELKLKKQVSLAIWKMGELIDIEWMYAEGPNLNDPLLDARLRDNYPFRRTSEKRLPEYFL